MPLYGCRSPQFVPNFAERVQMLYLVVSTFALTGGLPHTLEWFTVCAALPRSKKASRGGAGAKSQPLALAITCLSLHSLRPASVVNPP